MPLQMAEKSWVNIDAFIEAWLAALSYRGVKYPRVAEAIELARSNALAIKRYYEAFKAYFVAKGGPDYSKYRMYKPSDTKEFEESSAAKALPPFWEWQSSGR